MPTGIYDRSKGNKGWFKKGHKLGFKFHKIYKYGFQKGHPYGKRFKKGESRFPEYQFKKGQNLREKNWNWKNGQLKSNGYIYILQPSHPRANNHGYIKRAILVMEKHLGRYLKAEEVVHHRNEIKDDDRFKNLKLFATESKHQKFHWKLRRINKR